MDAAPPRPTAERIRHARARLEADIDLWVATASTDGTPYLIPLSHLWHDDSVLLATSARSATVRNIRRDGHVRLCLDGTRDVVLIDGRARIVPAAEVDPALADAYAKHTGWDPHDAPDNAWVLVTPVRVRAWREANEIAGREIMRDGVWVDDAD